MTERGRVLLVIHDVYQDDNQFLLGPAYIAAVLREHGTHVDTYCMDIFHHTNEELAQYLDENDYDLIGLGFMASRFKETVVGLTKTINEHKKDAWLVLGGHGPSPIPEYVLTTTRADIVTIGEVEHTIVALLEAKLAGGAGIAEVPGVAYWAAGEIKRTLRGKPVRRLDEIPLPAWDLFPMDAYTSSFKIIGQEEGDRSFVVVSSRGCSNACSFCYRLEKGVRVRSIAAVVDEMKILRDRYGVNCFVFLDEMFVLSKKRAFDLEKELDKADLQVKFYGAVRVDLFHDKELIRCLKRAGCTFLNFGTESTSDEVLRLMNKNATFEQNVRAIEAVKEVGGLGVGINVLWGNPGDDEASLRKNVDFVKKYNSYSQVRTIRPPTPYPGSALYYQAIDKGLLAGPADFFDRFANSDLLLVNFTDIPEKQFYELLFAANKELILDHHRNAPDGDMEAAERLVADFHGVYFEGKTKFRGARHYKNPEKAQKT